MTQPVATFENRLAPTTAEGADGAHTHAHDHGDGHTHEHGHGEGAAGPDEHGHTHEHLEHAGQFLSVSLLSLLGVS